ncbi:10711_t:CDS:2 [Paraglomus brasilianum]|uniref:10711_t:CDS:1 n=1 Tax=Paraglomus brasilianum TaxID=144538 RepID=A0A9N8VPL1_9GLOM|nr:10711_t:CDS:2 [Paraglomus brasilianum]
MGGTQSSQSGKGYHVLRVYDGSPAHEAGIEPFFDYVVGINGFPLDNPESKTLQEQLQDNINNEVILSIYSTKEQELREVTLIPNTDWTTKPEDGLIGLSIRFCSYEAINEHVWHILDVAPDSPAEMAGLVPYTDYIIGTPHVTLRGESDLDSLIESRLGRPLHLYVYNADRDVCREVIIVPNHEWGGEGSLGCGVGYGYLHRIPKVKKRRGSGDLNNKVANEVRDAVDQKDDEVSAKNGGKGKERQDGNETINEKSHEVAYQSPPTIVETLVDVDEETTGNEMPIHVDSEKPPSGELQTDITATE